MTFRFLLAAFAALIFYMRPEGCWLKVEHISVPAGIGLRIAVVSDLHPAFCRISSETAKAVMDREKPDLFLFLGDALDKPDHILKAAQWLGRCTGGIPAFAIPGNHDHRFFMKNDNFRLSFAKALSNEKIRLVSDGQFMFSKGSHHLKLTAIDDYPHAPSLEPVPGESEAGPSQFHLVFTHNPQRITELPAGYADFAVAGHFHGGQIWMPFGLEFRLFRKEPLGRTGIRRGLHMVNGIPLYLTRGIGNVIFPLRLGARPEITIIDLRQATPDLSGTDA
jgi:hypothetical protein